MKNQLPEWAKPGADAVVISHGTRGLDLRHYIITRATNKTVWVGGFNNRRFNLDKQGRLVEYGIADKAMAPVLVEQTPDIKAQMDQLNSKARAVLTVRGFLAARTPGNARSAAAALLAYARAEEEALTELASTTEPEPVPGMDDDDIGGFTK